MHLSHCRIDRCTGAGSSGVASWSSALKRRVAVLRVRQGASQQKDIAPAVAQPGGCTAVGPPGAGAYPSQPPRVRTGGGRCCDPAGAGSFPMSAPAVAQLLGAIARGLRS